MAPATRQASKTQEPDAPDPLRTPSTPKRPSKKRPRPETPKKPTSPPLARPHDPPPSPSPINATPTAPASSGDSSPPPASTPPTGSSARTSLPATDAHGGLQDAVQAAMDAEAKATAADNRELLQIAAFLDQTLQHLKATPNRARAARFSTAVQALVHNIFLNPSPDQPQHLQLTPHKHMQRLPPSLLDESNTRQSDSVRQKQTPHQDFSSDCLRDMQPVKPAHMQFYNCSASASNLYMQMLFWTYIIYRLALLSAPGTHLMDSSSLTRKRLSSKSWRPLQWILKCHGIYLSYPIHPIPIRVSMAHPVT